MAQLTTLHKSTSSTGKVGRNPEIKPLPLWGSLLLFGIPAGLTALSFHWFRPWLEGQGYPPITSFLGALTVPLALLLAAAMVGYHRVEGRLLEWSAFQERMRFPDFRLKDAPLGLSLFLAATLGYGLFSTLGQSLIQGGLIPLPADLPALVDPMVQFTPSVLDQMAGGEMQGQWGIVLLFLVSFFFNIAGEELWWRGYILPRQELTHGRWAWLFHGLLWSLFHLFKWWDLIGLLPVTLILSYAAQRLKNNWPVLIAHALFNGISLLIVTAGVSGLL